MSNKKPLKNLDFKLPTEEKEEDITRLYKDKNHRVKKELSFKTPKDKPKLT
ncbi:hypothetical protein KO500_15045 [Cellulophaga baltica]|uniref:hypothetical protein n=1 Tax=Cellulophaga TaxID=104264 RepID=UPI001C070433|nr:MULTISPECIES: hypothetical protein [Cellulophaga]MBU2997765.1 hypothetical protein [Cellulophaga baltica]MDO6769161.1 hypothetical protein [Cellulophaga sp. 1_MG-2023]